jgi:hypothetical protein
MKDLIIESRKILSTIWSNCSASVSLNEVTLESDESWASTADLTLPTLRNFEELILLVIGDFEFGEALDDLADCILITYSMVSDVSLRSFSSSSSESSKSSFLSSFWIKIDFFDLLSLLFEKLDDSEISEGSKNYVFFFWVPFPIL